MRIDAQQERPRLVRMGVLLIATAIFSAAAIAGDTWDVTNTGQPFVDAEFSVSEGTWMSVNVSPDARALAFDLLGDIYTIPATGGEAKLLHGGAAMQRNPRFSPDGRQLLYISDGGGSDNFWISNADGSGARQVTHETVRLLSTPAWSGDGAYIAGALQSATEDKHHAAELRLYDLRGGAGRILVPAPENREPVNEPQFSRDGRFLYYTEKVTPPTKPRVYVDANHSDLAIIRQDLRTGAKEQLIRGFGSAIAPQLSPDDRRIAFVQVATSGYSPLSTPHYAPPHVRAMNSIDVADELWDIGFRSVSRSVKKLDDAGVIVNAGSHGHVIGLALHWEMWLLSQGGMSNMNVLRTATLNGAKTLGLEGQLGSLEAGKLADLIVLDKNPLEDIRNSNSVRYTMMNGRLYDSSTMNEIGNYDRPRGKFFWEAHRAPNDIDWEKSWAEQ